MIKKSKAKKGTYLRLPKMTLGGTGNGVVTNYFNKQNPSYNQGAFTGNFGGSNTVSNPSDNMSTTSKWNSGSTYGNFGSTLKGLGTSTSLEANSERPDILGYNAATESLPFIGGYAAGAHGLGDLAAQPNKFGTPSTEVGAVASGFLNPSSQWTGLKRLNDNKNEFSRKEKVGIGLMNTFLPQFSNLYNKKFQDQLDDKAISEEAKAKRIAEGTYWSGDGEPIYAKKGGLINCSDGGKIPLSIKALDGKLKPINKTGIYEAIGKPHKTGGIKGDTNNDNKADIEFEGKEGIVELPDGTPYMINKDTFQKFKSQLSKVTPTKEGNKTLEILKKSMIKENDEGLAKSGKTNMMSKGGGFYSLGGEVDGDSTSTKKPPMRKDYPDNPSWQKDMKTYNDEWIKKKGELLKASEKAHKQLSGSDSSPAGKTKVKTDGCVHPGQQKAANAGNSGLKKQQEGGTLYNKTRTDKKIQTVIDENRVLDRGYEHQYQINPMTGDTVNQEYYMKFLNSKNPNAYHTYPQLNPSMQTPGLRPITKQSYDLAIKRELGYKKGGKLPKYFGGGNPTDEELLYDPRLTKYLEEPITLNSVGASPINNMFNMNKMQNPAKTTPSVERNFSTYGFDDSHLGQIENDIPGFDNTGIGEIETKSGLKKSPISNTNNYTQNREPFTSGEILGMTAAGANTAIGAALVARNKPHYVNYNDITTRLERDQRRSEDQIGIGEGRANLDVQTGYNSARETLNNVAPTYGSFLANQRNMYAAKNKGLEDVRARFAQLKAGLISQHANSRADVAFRNRSTTDLVNTQEKDAYLQGWADLNRNMFNNSITTANVMNARQGREDEINSPKDWKWNSDTSEWDYIRRNYRKG